MADSAPHSPSTPPSRSHTMRCHKLSLHRPSLSINMMDQGMLSKQTSGFLQVRSPYRDSWHSVTLKDWREGGMSSVWGGLDGLVHKVEMRATMELERATISGRLIALHAKCVQDLRSDIANLESSPPLHLSFNFRRLLAPLPH